MSLDFIPYELAKKLEEKGFNEPCIAHYSGGVLYYNSVDIHGEDEYIDYNISIIIMDLLRRRSLLAPTIYQVLKWFRKEKDIFIGLDSIGQNKCGCTIIIQKTGGLLAKWNFDKFQYSNKNPLVGNTYEEAAIAGIKYVIDNLI